MQDILKMTVGELLEAIVSIKELAPKIDQILKILSEGDAENTTKDTFLTIEELSAYLPGSPAVSTLRKKFQRREIPGRKVGKRIIFSKSEIDQWIISKKQHTLEELKEKAQKTEDFLSGLRNRNKKR